MHRAFRLLVPALLACAWATVPALSRAAAAPAPSGAANAPVPPGGGRLLLEAGWAVPLADLADGLDATPQGAGARPGFELGLAWRFALSPTWSLAPTMHYLGYRAATGLGNDGEQSLSASSLWYGLELMTSSRREGAQPFLALAPAVTRNRLEGPGKDHITVIDGSAGGLGLTLRAGVRFDDTELSLAWLVNRFSTRALFPGDAELDYDWNTVVLRVGWRLP
jgi:hypothetical protein